MRAAAIQADGRIVLGFDASNGAGIKICRLLRDGSLDAGFGNAPVPGCADFGLDTSTVNAIVIQPDGRIVVAGGGDFSWGYPVGFVARLEADGSPDTGFGDGGVVSLSPSSNSDTPLNAVALAPNGDVVAARRTVLGNSDFLFLKLAGADGKPVPIFGTWSAVVVASTLAALNTTRRMR